MRNSKIFIQRFFSGIVIFCFAWIIVAFLVIPRMGAIYSLFRMNHSLFHVIILDFIAALIALMALFSVRQFTRFVKNKKDLSDKTAWVLLLLEMILYSGGILIFLKYIGYYKTVDDAQFVYNWVTHYTVIDPWTHPSWLMHYLYANPQNLFLALTYKMVNLFLGNGFGGIVITFLAIYVLSIVLLFCTMRALKLDNWISLIVIQLLLISIQVTFHAAIAYTDILAFFFTSLTVYCFARYLLTHGKLQFFWLGLISLSSFFAFLSKGTSLVLIIALSIFIFVYNQRIKKLTGFIPILVLLLGNFGWTQAINYSGVYVDTNYGQPNTHYVMMGLSNTPIPDILSAREAANWSVGIYAAKDQDYSWNLFYNRHLSKSAITQKQIAVYKQRMLAMTPVQLCDALNNKVSVAWGSGDLKTSFSLIRGTHNQERTNKIFSEGVSGLVIYLIMTVSQLILYLGVIMALIKSWNKKEPVLLFGSIFLSGYFAFLLLWEVNPRYAIGIFPIALIMIGKSLGQQTSSKPMIEKESSLEE